MEFGIFFEYTLFILISISMNLFDQLVIVICDPVMKEGAPFWKEFCVLMIVCSIKCFLGMKARLI